MVVQRGQKVFFGADSAGCVAPACFCCEGFSGPGCWPGGFVGPGCCARGFVAPAV